MCSPDNGIFTDFGSKVPGVGAQSNIAGVLAVTDCTSSVWGGSPPSYCNSTNPNWPFQLRYALNADPTISGCDPNAGSCMDYINANFAWDPSSSCFRVRLDQPPTPMPVMSCLSTGVSGGSIAAPTVVKTINVSALGTALPGSPQNEFPISDVGITNTASNGSGDTIMIIGAKDSATGDQAVLAIDTSVSGGRTLLVLSAVLARGRPVRHNDRLLRQPTRVVCRCFIRHIRYRRLRRHRTAGLPIRKLNRHPMTNQAPQPRGKGVTQQDERVGAAPQRLGQRIAFDKPRAESIAL